MLEMKWITTNKNHHIISRNKQKRKQWIDGLEQCIYSIVQCSTMEQTDIVFIDEIWLKNSKENHSKMVSPIFANGTEKQENID